MSGFDEPKAADFLPLVSANVEQSYNDKDVIRAIGILQNMALENTGWKAFFRRWYISDEPLRHDAANLLRHMGIITRKPIGTQIVGDDL